MMMTWGPSKEEKSLGLTTDDLWALPLPVGPARNVFQLIQALKEKKGLLNLVSET